MYKRQARSIVFERSGKQTQTKNLDKPIKGRGGGVTMLIHFLNVNYRKIITPPPPPMLRAWMFNPMFSWIKIILKLCCDGIKYWLIFLKFTVFVLSVTFQSKTPGTTWATLFILLHFYLYSISLILYNFSYLWSLNDTISLYVALKQKGIMTHTCVHSHCNSVAMNVVFVFVFFLGQCTPN